MTVERPLAELVDRGRRLAQSALTALPDSLDIVPVLPDYYEPTKENVEGIGTGIYTHESQAQHGETANDYPGYVAQGHISTEKGGKNKGYHGGSPCNGSHDR